MLDQPPWRIMVVRRQFGNWSVARNEDNFSQRFRRRDDELRRGASVSGEPVDHPGVGVVLGCPGKTVRTSLPVGMCETTGVFVVRIARVGVLERCLHEGEQQARYDSKME
jgi:hypothetical protein